MRNWSPKIVLCWVNVYICLHLCQEEVQGLEICCRFAFVLLNSKCVYRISCCYSPELVFTPTSPSHCGNVTSSGPPCVLKLWLGVSKGMLTVHCFCLRKSFLCQLNFMEIIRLSQSSDKCVHPQLFWILLDLYLECQCVKFISIYSACKGRAIT